MADREQVDAWFGDPSFRGSLHPLARPDYGGAFRYTFTGTHYTRYASLYEPVTINAAQTLVDPLEVTTGLAPGVDVTAMRAAWEAFSDVHHRVVVPDAPHDEEAAQWAYEHGFEVVFAPNGRTKAESYRNRNRMMVDRFTDILIAVPLLAERRQPRSGTWQTVRLARKAAIPVVIEGPLRDLSEAAPVLAPPRLGGRPGAALDRSH